MALSVVRSELWNPGGTTSNYTYTWTTAPTTDDLLVMGLWRYEQSSHDGHWDAVDTVPSGWQLDSTLHDGSGVSPYLQIAIFSRKAGSSPGSDNLNVTSAGARVHVGAGAQINGQAASFFEAASTYTSGTGTGTTIPTTSISNVQAAAMAVAFFGFDDNDFTANGGSIDESFIIQEEDHQATGHDLGACLATKIVPAVTAFNPTWTPAGSPGAEERRSLVAIYKEAGPAAATGGVYPLINGGIVHQRPLLAPTMLPVYQRAQLYNPKRQIITRPSPVFSHRRASQWRHAAYLYLIGLAFPIRQARFSLSR